MSGAGISPAPGAAPGALAARIAAWAAEGRTDALAALEALADPRVATRPADPAPGLPAERLLREAAALPGGRSPESLGAELSAAGAVADGGLLALPEALAADARPALAAVAAARPLAWSPEPLTQGEVVARFASYCRDELDDVEVVSEGPGPAAVLRWRDETARIEARIASLFAERRESGPWLLLCPGGPAVVEQLLDSPDLRARAGVWDLADLARITAIRSSIAVHLDWFLRDAYRVKVLPAQAWTEGLLARGIISLGM